MLTKKQMPTSLVLICAGKTIIKVLLKKVSIAFIAFYLLYKQTEIFALSFVNTDHKTVFNFNRVMLIAIAT